MTNNKKEHWWDGWNYIGIALAVAFGSFVTIEIIRGFL